MNNPTETASNNEVVEIYYQLQWKVPKENSLSKAEYWHDLNLPGGGKFTCSLEEAKEFWATAQKNFKPGEVRLVEVKKTQLAG